MCTGSEKGSPGKKKESLLTATFSDKFADKLNCLQKTCITDEPDIRCHHKKRTFSTRQKLRVRQRG